MNSDNRGFSLVELIVVILIMAIMAGGAVMSAVVIHDADVSAAADELVAMLTSTRKTSIAREDGTVRLVLTMEDDKYYACMYYDDDNDSSTDEVVLDKQKLGGKSIKITVSGIVGAADKVVTASNPVEFHFKKANGSLNEAYTKIKIEGSKTEEITVIKETGRCIME